MSDNTDQELILNDVLKSIATLLKRNEHVIRGTAKKIDFEMRSGLSFRAIYFWCNKEHDPKVSNFIAFANTLDYEVIIRPKISAAVKTSFS